jgi:hypothetical protein
MVPWASKITLTQKDTFVNSTAWPVAGIIKQKGRSNDIAS